jgi:flavin reductase (DIM6/NTAB) family NADH-FMN oxidoreductase RutF
MRALSPSTTDLVESVKEVHRRFPTGVTVVTVCIDGVPYGLAVNAFSSLSLDPPSALVCVAATSATYERFFVGEHLAVNMLASDQAAVARRFATSGGDKFRDLAWRRGRGGSPILEGAAAHLELEIEARVPAHTHAILIGQVVDAVAHDRNPLVYLGGRFYDGDALRGLSSSVR